MIYAAGVVDWLIIIEVIMEDKCKIMYEYFFSDIAFGMPVAQIPKKKDDHKQKLLKIIQKKHPHFMHPYSFMAPPDHELDRKVHEIITLFENNHVKGLKRLKIKWLELWNRA